MDLIESGIYRITDLWGVMNDKYVAVIYNYTEISTLIFNCQIQDENIYDQSKSTKRV